MKRILTGSAFAAEGIAAIARQARTQTNKRFMLITPVTTLKAANLAMERTSAGGLESHPGKTALPRSCTFWAIVSVPAWPPSIQTRRETWRRTSASAEIMGLGKEQIFP